MPSLKQLTASVELGQSRTKITEYGARYSDGVVESFIAVPNTKVPFCVHVESHGYIAPGLGVFVFMDGEYQCNRNRFKLKLPGDGVPAAKYEVDFTMRQKEEKAADGTFVGRGWTFAELNTTKSDNAATLNPEFIKNVGTIEIIVLRVKGPGQQIPTPELGPSSGKEGREALKVKSPKSVSFVESVASSVASSRKQRPAEPIPSVAFSGLNGMFDGAGDEPPNEPKQKFHPPPFDHIPKPDRPDGRVIAELDSRLTWDEIAMEMAPRNVALHSPNYYETKALIAEANAYSPAPSDAQANDNLQTDILSGENRDDRSDVYNDHRPGQLDGHGGQPQVVVNNNIGRDDMTDDKYFGAKGVERGNMKSRMKEQGIPVSVSQYAQGNQRRDDVMQGFRHVQNPNAAPGVQQKAPHPAYAPPRQQPQQPQQAKQPHQQPNQPAVNANQQTDMIQELLAAAAATKQMPVVPFKEIPAKLREFDERLEQIKLLMQMTDLQAQSGHMGEEAYKQQRNVLHQLHDEYCAFGETLARGYDLELQKCKAKGAQPNALNHAGQQQAGQGQANAPVTGQFDFHRKNMAQAAPPNAYNNVRQQLGGQGQANAQAQGQYVPQGANAATNWNPIGGGVVGGGAALNQDWMSKYEHLLPIRAGNKAGQANMDYNGGYGGSAYGDSQRGGGQLNDNRQNDGNGSQRSSHSQTLSHATWNNNGAQQNAGGDAWNAGGSKDDQKNDNGGWGGNDQGAGQADQGKAWGDSGSNANQHANDAPPWGGSQQSDRTKNGGGWGDGGKQKTPSVASFQAARFDAASVSPITGVKPYFETWRNPAGQGEGSADPNAAKKREVPRPVYDYPAAPLPAVPADQLRTATLAVQPGKGAHYSHRCHRPEYLDSMTEPYAVFSFKYRSKAGLEKILGRSITIEFEPLMAQAEKEKLMDMPKHKLIEELTKARTPQKEGQGGSVKADSVQGGSVKSASGGWGGAPAENKSADGGWGGDKKSDSGNGGNWAAPAAGSVKSPLKSILKQSSSPTAGWANGGGNNNGSAAGWGSPAKNNAQATGDNGWEKTPANNWDGGNDAMPRSPLPMSDVGARGFNFRYKDQPKPGEYLPYADANHGGNAMPQYPPAMNDAGAAGFHLRYKDPPMAGEYMRNPMPNYAANAKPQSLPVMNDAGAAGFNVRYNDLVKAGEYLEYADPNRGGNAKPAYLVPQKEPVLQNEPVFKEKKVNDNRFEAGSAKTTFSGLERKLMADTRVLHNGPVDGEGEGFGGVKGGSEGGYGGYGANYSPSGVDYGPGGKDLGVPSERYAADGVYHAANMPGAGGQGVGGQGMGVQGMGGQGMGVQGMGGQGAGYQGVLGQGVVGQGMGGGAQALARQGAGGMQQIGGGVVRGGQALGGPHGGAPK